MSRSVHVTSMLFKLSVHFITYHNNKSLEQVPSHIPTLKSRSSGVGTIKWREIKQLINKYLKEY